MNSLQSACSWVLPQVAAPPLTACQRGRWPPARASPWHTTWIRHRQVRSAFVPRWPCHSRATSDGQPRYRADNHGHIYATDELGILAGPARTHPANVPDKDEGGGSSPPRPTTSNNQRERSSRVRLNPGAAAVQRLTPHNWHNFLRCHGQLAASTAPLSCARQVGEARQPPCTDRHLVCLIGGMGQVTASSDLSRSCCRPC
jgi:hypothetical protein